MGAFSRLFKDLAEANAGRIKFFPSIYEYVYMDHVDDGEELQSKFPGITFAAIDTWQAGSVRVFWRNEKGNNVMIERDGDRIDRVIMLRKGEAKQCFHPEMHTDSDPYIDNKGAAWVKKSVCQKCEHYRKRNDPRNKHKFPICAHPERETGPTPADIVSEAVKTTNRLIGK